jgi:putative peptide zinc metalloprotease protein
MSSLHSPRWHRVAALRPRLAEGLSVRRQHVRGVTWIVLHQPARGRSLRLNPSAWRLAARLDGSITVQALWDAALAHGEEPPTQDELIELLAQLRDAGLLRAGPGADVERLLEHQDRIDRPAGRRSILAWRVPLGDPARLLARGAALGRMLFSPTVRRPGCWRWWRCSAWRRNPCPRSGPMGATGWRRRATHCSRPWSTCR